MSDLFNKLAAQEKEFRSQEFLSPVLRGQKIRVRIAGVVMSLSVVKPAKFEGWGIFRPLDFHKAAFVREPALAEKSKYFKLFPTVRLVVSHRSRNKWLGVPAGRQALQVGNFVPIELPDPCDRFQTILTRFDGLHCWFESIDQRRSRRFADQLADHLNRNTVPTELPIRGCTSVEKWIYQNAWNYRNDPSSQPHSRLHHDERYLRQALRHGGGTYVSHRDIEDGYCVVYEVNGKTYRSTVSRSNLEIRTAGFCLDGFDTNFDLQSLVGVIAEGQRTGQLWME